MRVDRQRELAQGIVTAKTGDSIELRASVRDAIGRWRASGTVGELPVEGVMLLPPNATAPYALNDRLMIPACGLTASESWRRTIVTF